MSIDCTNERVISGANEGIELVDGIACRTCGPTFSIDIAYEAGCEGLLLVAYFPPATHRRHLHFTTPSGKVVRRNARAGWSYYLLTTDQLEWGDYEFSLRDGTGALLSNEEINQISIAEVSHYRGAYESLTQLPARLFHKPTQFDFSPLPVLDLTGSYPKCEQSVIDAMPMPRMMTIDLTQLCNLRCPMCWRENVPWNNKSTSLNTNAILQTLAYIHNSPIHLDLAGSGEAMMHPDFSEIVDFAALNKKAFIVLRTNGAYIDKNIDAVMRLSHIDISLEKIDGYEETRVNGTIEKLASNLRLVNSLRKQRPGPSLGLSIIPMRMNLEQFDKILDFAVEHQIAQISGQHLESFKENDEFFTRETCFTAKDEYDAALGVLRAQTKITIALPVYFAPERAAEHEAAGKSKAEAIFARHAPPVDWQDFPWHSDRPRLHSPDYRELWQVASEVKDTMCPSPWTEVRINAAGAVCPCCSSGAPSLGNINNQPLSEIWADKYYRQVREGIVNLKPICRCSITSRLGRKLNTISNATVAQTYH